MKRGGGGEDGLIRWDRKGEESHAGTTTRGVGDAGGDS